MPISNARSEPVLFVFILNATCMDTGYIKLFVVLGYLTELCLIGHGFIQKSFLENKEFGSRSDRRLTQVVT